MKARIISQIAIEKRNKNMEWLEKRKCERTRGVRHNEPDCWWCQEKWDCYDGSIYKGKQAIACSEFKHYNI